jgi:hypothetical protein
MDATAPGLSVNQEFLIHAAALTIKDLDRDDLEEAFLNALHQNMQDRQTFLNILKQHGIDAEITFTYTTLNQLF